MVSVSKNKAVAISLALLVVGLAIGVIIGIYAVPPREVIKEVPKEVIKEVPKEVIREVPKEVIKEVPKEVIMTLPTLAEKIRKGEIDVGEVYGMAPDQRYHTIHATTIGLDCTNCHVKQVAPETIFAQVPPGAPGPVDRRVCLGCHLTGPAFNLYGPSEEVEAAPSAKAAPQIPHPIEGRENCLMCHKVGGAGVAEPGGLGMPEDHEDRTADVCQTCHTFKG